MQTVEKLISILSGWVWGPPMLILLVGTGLFFDGPAQGSLISRTAAGVSYDLG